MTSYYNDNDKYCAQWLRNLILEKLIAKGDVDDRSIKEVTSKDVKGYRQAHFFAGIGGWSLALRLAGWPDSREVWTGSCPCQPFSASGSQKGFSDSRDLWPSWSNIIKQRKPSVLFGEQTPAPLGRKWLARVHSNLERMGYQFAASDLCAAGLKAPHQRQRLWFVADADGRYTSAKRLQRSRQYRQRSINGKTFWSASQRLLCTDGKFRRIEPKSFPVANGIPNRVAKLRAFGNAIVPQVAAEFIKAFMDCKP